MGRINSYPKETRPSSSDVAILDGSSGTRVITLSDLSKELPGMVSVEMHRNTFRGKNLGSTYTDAQKAAVKSGTFDDLYVGDYWCVGNIVYRIADINYWKGFGPSSRWINHLVITTDKPLYTAQMNDTKTTTGAYTGSKMYREGLNVAITQIQMDFGASYILIHDVYLSSSMSPSGNYVTSSTLSNSMVDLPSEIMLFGSRVLGASNSGNNDGIYPVTIDSTQLAIMRIYRPYLIAYGYWTRSIFDNQCFITVSSNGVATYSFADESLGVRPVFGLTGG